MLEDKRVDIDEKEKIIDEKEDKKDRKEEKESLGSWIKTIALYVFIALLIRIFVFNITIVEGSSMYPTLVSGDKLFTEKVTRYFDKKQKGKIVVIDAPDGSKRHFIKRVIGVEGDKIEIKDDGLYINDVLQEEVFLNGVKTFPLTGTRTWTVPEGQIFVMGDNREHSNDSRAFGPVPVDSVVGYSVFRITPFSSFGRIK